MSKVEVDQNEATEIFNNMIRGLEQQGAQEEHDSTDKRAMQFLQKNRSRPEEKYKSLDNLASNVNEDLMNEG